MNTTDPRFYPHFVICQCQPGHPSGNGVGALILILNHQESAKWAHDFGGKNITRFDVWSGRCPLCHHRYAILERTEMEKS